MAMGESSNDEWAVTIVVEEDTRLNQTIDVSGNTSLHNLIEIWKEKLKVFGNWLFISNNEEFIYEEFLTIQMLCENAPPHRIVTLRAKLFDQSINGLWMYQNNKCRRLTNVSENEILHQLGCQNSRRTQLMECNGALLSLNETVRKARLKNDSVIHEPNCSITVEVAPKIRKVIHLPSDSLVLQLAEKVNLFQTGEFSMIYRGRHLNLQESVMNLTEVVEVSTAEFSVHINTLCINWRTKSESIVFPDFLSQLMLKFENIETEELEKLEFYCVGCRRRIIHSETDIQILPIECCKEKSLTLDALLPSKRVTKSTNTKVVNQRSLNHKSEVPTTECGKKLEEENRRLKSKIRELESNNKKMKEEKKWMLCIIEKSVTDTEMWAEQNGVLRNEIKKLKAYIESLENEMRKSNEKKPKTLRWSHPLGPPDANLIEIENLKEEIKGLKKENKKMKEKIRKVDEVGMLPRELIDRLKEEHMKSTEDNKVLKKYCQRLLEENGTLKGENGRLKDENRKLEYDYKNSTKDIEILMEKMKTSDENVKMIKDELDRQKTVNIKIEDENRSLKERTRKMEAENRKSIEDMKNERGSPPGEIRNLIGQIKELENEIKRLEEEKKSSSLENRILSDNNERLENENKTMRQEITKLRAKNEQPTSGTRISNDDRMKLNEVDGKLSDKNDKSKAGSITVKDGKTALSPVETPQGAIAPETFRPPSALVEDFGMKLLIFYNSELLSPVHRPGAQNLGRYLWYSRPYIKCQIPGMCAGFAAFTAMQSALSQVFTCSSEIVRIFQWRGTVNGRVLARVTSNDKDEAERPKQSLYSNENGCEQLSWEEAGKPWRQIIAAGGQVLICGGGRRTILEI